MGERIRGQGYVGNAVPRVLPEEHMKIYRAYHRALREGLVRSAASLGAGGLAVAACRTALGGDLGVEIDPDAVVMEPGDGIRRDRILYGESQGRILISVSQEQVNDILRLFQGLSCSRVGKILEAPVLRVLGPGGGEPTLEVPLETLRRSYQETLGW
jgi:phosphoribosylformylglycinamidine synthase